MSTTGAHSDGVYAYSGVGNIDVHTGTVMTTGNNSAGVYLLAGGTIVDHSTYASTTGPNSPKQSSAHNLGTTRTDTIAIYSGTVVTRGANSDGIEAKGYYSTYVNSGSVTTHGPGSIGIYARSVNGPVDVLSGSVHTYYQSGLRHRRRRHRRGCVGDVWCGLHRRLLLHGHRRLHGYGECLGHLDAGAHLLQFRRRYHCCRHDGERHSKSNTVITDGSSRSGSMPTPPPAALT